MRETERKIYNFEAELQCIEDKGKTFLDKNTPNEEREILKKWLIAKLKEYRMRSESKEFFGGGAPRSFTVEEYSELCDKVLDILAAPLGENV